MNIFGKKPLSAQESIPLERAFPDGICRSGGLYTKSLRFRDANYELCSDEDQTALFEGWRELLNSLDPAVRLQLTLANLPAPEEPVSIPPRGDGFDPVRREYEEILRRQLAQGNRHVRREKYLTFGIEAESAKAARPRLERIEAGLLERLRKLGTEAGPLDGQVRLELLCELLHMDGVPARFDWERQALSGLSERDFIAPSSFVFTGRGFRMGERYGEASFLQIMASELSDRLLAELLEGEEQIVSLHLQPLEQAWAVKRLKQQLTDLDRRKIDEQKKAFRAGYDSDILPADLTAYGSGAHKLLQDLQSRNERMFLATVLLAHTAGSRRELENRVSRAGDIARQHSCRLVRLDFQQERGLMSVLPLGRNDVEIQRGLTTSSTAVLLPFRSHELRQTGPDALYYGMNALTGYPVFADRKRLKNPNGLILGTPGSGKSFAAKREIVNVFLTTGDDLLIADPEAEYHPLVERLGGQVVKISPSSCQYVNPMDLNLEDENPLALKADFLLSFLDIVAGGGLRPVEKAVVDRCARLVYRAYLADPRPERMPLLEDLYLYLLEQEEPEARRLAAALELYVSGSLSLFNHRTNVDVRNRLVCYDLKELGKQLKQLGMLVVQDQIWNRVAANRSAGKSTRYYADEFHLLLQGGLAAWSVEIWKRFRKWGGIPTGITQNSKDLLASPEISNILENSDFVLLLNQAAGDREILARQLRISPRQMEYVTQSGEGEGLLIYGDTILPVADRFPRDTELYRILTTKFQEVQA